MKLRRVMAFFIDVMIVGIVVGGLSNIRNLNPYYDDYLETQEKIMDIYKNVDENNIKDLLLKSDNIDLYRDLSKYNSVTSIISISCYLLYFVGFQKWNKGQTVGKKLMRLKVVSIDKGDCSWTNYIIRTVIVFNLLFSSLNIWVSFKFSGTTYLTLISLFGMIGNLITFITYMMILFREDGRGLHDILAHTKVERA